MTLQPCSAWKPRAPSFLARPIATNSRWAARTKTLPTDRCAIRKRPIACLAAPVEARLRLAAVSSRRCRCRIPAMMPSYGRVSRYGLIAFASSLDRIGPFATNVRDVAAVMQIIAGRDVNDSTSTAAPVPNYGAEAEKPVKGLRIGIPKEYFGTGMDPEVRKKVEAGIELYRKLGCEVREIRMPHTDYAIAVYYIIATAEASSNLARYDGVRYGLRVDGDSLLSMYRKTRGAGFGAEVKRRIVLGTYVLSAGYYDAYYLKGQKVRSLIAQDFRDAFTKVDAIVTPTSPVPAFKLGERTNDPLQMYL